MRKYILLSIGLIFLLRTSTWLLPMQRDALGFAYIGKQIAQGAVIYRDVWDHKPPGIYFLNMAIYKFFPERYIEGLHWLNLASAIVAAALLFVLLMQYVSVKTAGMTTVLFSVFTNMYFLTVGDNLIEGYMVSFLILSYIVFGLALRQRKNVWFLLTGASIGILFLFKQVGVLPFLSFAAYLFIEKNPKKLTSLASMTVGFIVALLPFIFYVVAQGITFEAIDAIFLYNVYYSKQAFDIHSLGQSFYYALQVIFATLLFWVLFVAGFLKEKYDRSDILFVLLFIASFIGVAMGGRFAFTRHYFLLLFPSMAYFVARAIDKPMFVRLNRSLRSLLLVAGAALLLPSLVLQTQVFLSGLYYSDLIDFGKKENQYLLGLPQYNFVEEEKVYQQIASYITTQISPGDYVLDWGAEIEVYVLTDTNSPTRYFYNFPLNGTFIAYDPFLEKRREIFLKDLTTHYPLFIIVNDEEVKHQPSFKSLNFPLFKDFLAKYYRQDAKIGNFLLFKKQINQYL